MNRIELLSKEHDRESFDCGNENLNLFLRQISRQHNEKGISKTYVLVDENSRSPKEILGFFSLNICQVEAGKLPHEFIKKFPRLVAGIKIGRLAVNKHYQRQGLGRMLVVAALEKCLQIFEIAGGIGVFVDAKDVGARDYYFQFGFKKFQTEELQMFLPMETARELLR